MLFLGFRGGVENEGEINMKIDALLVSTQLKLNKTRFVECKVCVAAEPIVSHYPKESHMRTLFQSAFCFSLPLRISMRLIPSASIQSLYSEKGL